MPATRPAPVRFWEKVRKTHTCWNWTAFRNRHGYGQFWTGERLVLAHRWTYEHLVGEIPEGLVLDHLCRNPRCVNPEHLEAVTQVENIARGTGWSARNARKTHCPHGHEYTPENTRIDGGSRKCKTCMRAWQREYKRRRKAA